MGGKRLGVLGLGRSGAPVAQMGLAFEMDVVAWSQNLTAEKAKAAGAELVTIDALEPAAIPGSWERSGR